MLEPNETCYNCLSPFWVLYCNEEFEVWHSFHFIALGLPWIEKLGVQEFRILLQRTKKAYGEGMVREGWEQEAVVWKEILIRRCVQS